MEPAWRQQGRGRGRGQDAQGQRSRPLQKERPAVGPGPRMKTNSTPEPLQGDEELKLWVLSTPGPDPVLNPHTHLFLFCQETPGSRRSESPTRLLPRGWWRTTMSAPLPLMKTTMMMMMETSREGRSWSPPLPPTRSRQVRVT